MSQIPGSRRSTSRLVSSIDPDNPLGSSLSAKGAGGKTVIRRLDVAVVEESASRRLGGDREKMDTGGAVSSKGTTLGDELSNLRRLLPETLERGLKVVI